MCDRHASDCPTCTGEHPVIGTCLTCGYPVFRDCQGDLLHRDYAEVFEHRHGMHLAQLGEKE